MRVRRSWLLAIAAIAAAVLALGGAALRERRQREADRRSHPPLAGALRVAGLRGAAIEVLRDARGVPQVRAANAADAWFGLGFVHAQDRLAQMLWWRRVAQGRSAAAIGRPGLASDRLARTLDFAGAGEKALAELDDITRSALASYAAGVEAHLDLLRAGRVAPPRTRLELELGAWRPQDSLAVLQCYAWSLAGSVETSLVLEAVLDRLGASAARIFFPSQGVAGDLGPSVVRAAPRSGRAGDVWRDPLRALLGFGGASLGSSAWLVGGQHSRSGQPLLVADAHLPPTAPPLFHLVHLAAGEFEVAGAALPGVPVFWGGSNGRIAWATTQPRAVVVDLFDETLHPDDANLYHDGAAWRRLSIRRETIEVRGEAEQVLEVRSTRHGPLWNPLLEAERDPLAVAWSGQPQRAAASLAALQALSRATNAESFRRALDGHAAPALWVLWAEQGGQAELRLAGAMPRRALRSGLVPLAGALAVWRGSLAPNELPEQRLAGGRGWSIAADQAIGGEAPDIEWFWRDGARAARIDERLRQSIALGPLDLAQAAAPLFDRERPQASALVARALDALGNAPEGHGAEIFFTLLRDWNGSADVDSAGAAAAAIFEQEMLRALLEARLGVPLAERYASDPRVETSALLRDLLDPALSEASPAPRALLSGVMQRSARRLAREAGGELQHARWGLLHRLQFRAREPGVLPEPGIEALEIGGAGDTVETTEHSALGGFEVRLAPTFRYAVDLAQPRRIHFALAPGQSEHPGQLHVADGIEGWRRGELDVLDMEATPESAQHRLRLESEAPR